MRHNWPRKNFVVIDVAGGNETGIKSLDRAGVKENACNDEADTTPNDVCSMVRRLNVSVLRETSTGNVGR